MENNRPLISIVICTYNNADSLAITLQQINVQEVSDPGQIELVVVDNNSPDHTAQFLKSFDSEKFAYRQYFEPRQGVSHARNTGFENALGEYVLYVDDDADLPQHWLEKYVRRISETHADCLFGKISVVWDKPKPWWYDDDRFQGFFATINYSDVEFKVTTKSHPFFSKNACIKKSCLVEIGGFDTSLGRKGNVLTGGEEVLVYYRLVESNKHIYYYPDIAVGHRLKPREYTEENITNQYLACAKPIVQIAKLQPGKRLFKKPLGVLENQIKDMLDSSFRLFKAYFAKDKKEAFYQSLRLKLSILVIKFWLAP